MPITSYLVDSHVQSLVPITEKAHSEIIKCISNPFFNYYNSKVFNLTVSKNTLISLFRDKLKTPNKEVSCFNRTITNFQLFENGVNEYGHTDYFININIDERNEYIRYSIGLLAYTEEVFNRVFSAIEEVITPYLLTYNTISVKWYYASNNGIDYSYFEEKSVDDILPQSYPYVSEGIENYVKRFIESKESVLILIGSPGTGKTSLIRYIMSQYIKNSKKNNKRGMNKLIIDEPSSEDGSVYYTADTTVLERDDMFINFATNQSGIMIMEDIDLHLSSRSDGNTFMYKLLGASDGLMKNISRKIIISTNLSNVKDIDDALIRPGRCFDTLHTRKLNKSESLDLLQVMEPCDIVNDKIKCLNNINHNVSYSLAELYSTNKLEV